ncbi:MAG: hypothetical protein JST16_16670 [Bdellovibrionales bacterium]|nr:hypothetical protein [Bdellovibrionales bacterium]
MKFILASLMMMLVNRAVTAHTSQENCAISVDEALEIIQKYSPIFSAMKDVDGVSVGECRTFGPGCCFSVGMSDQKTVETARSLFPNGLVLDTVALEFYPSSPTLPQRAR